MRGLHIQRPARAARVVVLAVAALALTVGPALANPVPTTPEPPIACEAGTGLVTRYVTTVHTPADATDWWVSVEFTVADSDAAAACELSLATYEMAGADFTYPQALYDSDSGTFPAGTHTLTAALPLEGDLEGCWSQYDFVFGPAIEELTFENRYDQRQIRARIVGSAECPTVVTETSSPTPTPSPSPSPTDGIAGGTPTPTPVVTVESPSATPRGGVAGGNPTPTPAGGALPDTSLPGATPIALLAGLLGLTMLGSISALALVNVRARNTRR